MYHFTAINDEGKPYLRYDDNRVVEVGVPVTVMGNTVLCEHGLHASARILDALQYCPSGSVALCEVTLGGAVVDDTDKSVGTERTIVRMLTPEATEKLLRDFARWCALQVSHLWEMPDVVREYMETGDESKRAAAKAAAWAAAWAEERAAARSAGWAAGWAAAWAAARAAREAAGAAAWAEERAEGRAAQEAKLVEMFEVAHG